ncbi:probable RNA helicase armi [Contarinia nasturtii]|uniref:probable RNA helicase armi n=1 Tax=Contarinia nasturtii TaxID=265458 RepID=UPI0012D388D2|nr:probable RNA helicase armi [Contarinia nasturtii]
MVRGLYHEINAFIEGRTDDKLITTSGSDVYKDVEILLNDVECDFSPWKGDRVRLYIIREDPPRVYKIQPWEDLRIETGQITMLTKSFGVVNEEIVFYPEQSDLGIDWEAKVGDEVKFVAIEGEYDIGKTKYEWRCENIKKFVENEENEKDVKLWFGDETDGTEHGSAVNNIDTDTEILQDEPNIMCIASKKKLDELVPRALSYKNYKKRFHALIFLEEIEMKASFKKYKSREVWIEPERKKRFSIMCSKIKELRPSISIGDKIEVRNSKKSMRYYRGIVERVREDRFILKFKQDFEEDYILGDTYGAQFFYSRTIYQRKHAAIDYAKRKLSESFLFPTELTLANNLQLNAELKDDKLMIADNEVPWFKDNLNTEQKFAVASALRAECRPYPFIVYGPPGTGKTSTLIEIILQVYTHLTDCKILVATQSNNAANLVASRLIAQHPETATNMLRLVSNAVLDRKILPKDLYKVSASVMNANIEEDNTHDDYDDIPADIRRNCNLEYLKKFKIIVGTCVGLGVMFGSEYSNGYFSHVLIDEAAQCNECEALIPISFVNLEHGQVIMAGDPLQLPPITLSNHAKHYDLVRSMLERYINTYKTMDGVVPGEDNNGYDHRLVTKLRRNYRALPSIMKFYNKQFYDSLLIATLCGDSSPEAMKLRDLTRILPKRTDSEDKNPFGYCFINVEGRNERMENKKSWENKEEVAIIKAFIPKLLDRRIDQEDIGVITPYHAQVMALRKELKHMKRITVGTVEEFQGEEKKVIIISAVKTSGKEKALQFIYCPKRLNTALSRARMLVVIFGKVNLLEADPNWADLISYCKEHESYIDGKDIIQIL